MFAKHIFKVFAIIVDIIMDILEMSTTSIRYPHFYKILHRTECCVGIMCTVFPLLLYLQDIAPPVHM